MENNSVALERVMLKHLNPSLENALIVGIIIGKQKPKQFLDKKAAVETYKAVWNFTFRDSIQDYINVTYWGPSEVIFQANDRFSAGDVVEIINPRIAVRSFNDLGEQYRPMVTSPYNLFLSATSAIVHHNGSPNNYLPLLNYSTKPIAGYLSLRDIHSNGLSMKDNYIDVLAVVKGLGQIRSIRTKSLENMQVRTIEVFDYTSVGLKIDLWEADIIKRSENWKPRRTALFFSDLKVQWSNFQRQYIAKSTSRTIVTENPQGRDVDDLLKFAANAPINTYEIVDQLITSLPDVSTIQDIMSVNQVQNKINVYLQENRAGSKQFTALLFAFVSSLDLDGLSRTLMIKCGKCKMQMNEMICKNNECPTVFDQEVTEPDIKFDLRIALTDHTGSLFNCRLSGQAAEQAFSCTAYEFSSMSDDQKCTLKWKYLMDRCAVYIAVVFVGTQNPVISVLQIKVADKNEAPKQIPVY